MAITPPSVAGLATTLATLGGVIAIVFYFVKLEHYVGFEALPLPRRL